MYYLSNKILHYVPFSKLNIENLSRFPQQQTLIENDKKPKL